MRPSGKLDSDDVPEDPPENHENEQQYGQETAVHFFIETRMGVFKDEGCGEKDQEWNADDYHRIVEEGFLEIQMQEGMDCSL